MKEERASAAYRSRRRGFALLAVLWVIVGVTALTAAIAALLSDAHRATRNRIALTRAQWFAEGCVETARALTDRVLQSPDRAQNSWVTLDTVLAHAPALVGCHLDVVPSGLRLDVNTLSDTSLRTVLAAASVPAVRIDSLVDALLDWRDADDLTRPNGAERAWYQSKRRLSPHNGLFTGVEELSLVRGLERDTALLNLFDVESSAVLIDRAPLPILAALPGITPGALRQIAATRADRRRVGDLAVFATRLDPDDRRILLSHFAEVATRTTDSPDAWTITARASTSKLSPIAVVEERIVRTGHRAAVVRRRTWP